MVDDVDKIGLVTECRLRPPLIVNAEAALRHTAGFDRKGRIRAFDNMATRYATVNLVKSLIFICLPGFMEQARSVGASNHFSYQHVGDKKLDKHVLWALGYLFYALDFMGRQRDIQKYLLYAKQFLPLQHREVE
jgi:hypothetical protein